MKRVQAMWQDPFIRVAVLVAMPLVLLLYGMAATGLAEADGWWLAAAEALLPTGLGVAVAVYCFRGVVRRCSRCRAWTDLAEDGAGQVLCRDCRTALNGL